MQGGQQGDGMMWPPKMLLLTICKFRVKVQELSSWNIRLGVSG